MYSTSLLDLDITDWAYGLGAYVAKTYCMGAVEGWEITQRLSVLLRSANLTRRQVSTHGVLHAVSDRGAFARISAAHLVGAALDDADMPVRKRLVIPARSWAEFVWSSLSEAWEASDEQGVDLVLEMIELFASFGLDDRVVRERVPFVVESLSGMTSEG